jgi:hypothetical protein
MIVTLENKNYHVEDNEFTTFTIQEYCNLKLYNELAKIERIVALINECCSLSNNSHFAIIQPTHGGFIPINCNKAKKISLFSCVDNHLNNIQKNIIEQKILNINIKNNFDLLDSTEELLFLYDNLNINNIFNYQFFTKIHGHKNLFILTSNFSKILETNAYSTYYHFSKTNLFLFVPDNFKDIFHNEFHYFIEKNELNYDNLINLCIMVKNAGPQFEQMLKENMSLIDQWTILDTGSTDETIDIINKTLVGVKKGKLYQEPFINFKESRNRCLDLAGTNCKYTIMLDDTYIVKGDLRQFLNDIRSDQFGDSYSMYIKSDDVEYSSNRILKTNRKLRYIYRIHEVITNENNKNVITPIDKAYIFDGRFEYMEKRTMDRKSLDLKLLQEEIDEDPNNPRSYYYMAQTYNLLENHQLAYDYFLQRANHPIEGFLQEKIDAIFEAARIANFKLNKSWDECEKLYFRAYELDKTRPDSLYFIGIHYYLNNDFITAFKHFKKAFEIGYPIHAQYSLKPTLSFHFLPKFLTEICYYVKEYELGLKVSRFFLENNKTDIPEYELIMSWYKIYNQISLIPKISNKKFHFTNNKPYICFVADGGFSEWSGSSILKNGVGGSETYIIEMARHIQRQGYFQVFVFCNCLEKETFENVEYLPLKDYYDFITQYNVQHVIISRFSEYYPATLLCNVENIYFVVHDLSLSGIIVPVDKKLKKIFCLTEWHVDYFNKIFPSLKELTCPLYYGINPIFQQTTKKQPYSFIYSSFPGRGLLELLTMWPKIYEKQPLSTLHIYSDVYNKWSNSVEPKKMESIRNLLEKYNASNNGLNIFYHGWVDKKTLADAWAKSEYWLYPCTFMETFCLTALEAAITKTLPITNNLAALQNTVGDRGLIIEGDASTEEWQNKTLNEIFKIMNDSDRKNKLLEKNYQWASNLSWESQAHKLLNGYIFMNTINNSNILSKPIDKIQLFTNIINYFKSNCKNPIPNILEISTHKGDNIIYFVKNIPHSLGYAIDLWNNGNEIFQKEFELSVNNENLNNRIRSFKGDSSDIMFDFILKKLSFDLIHLTIEQTFDIYTNLFLSWKLLTNNGIIIINNNNNNTENISDIISIKSFLNKYKNSYQFLIHPDNLIILQKI